MKNRQLKRKVIVVATLAIFFTFTIALLTNNKNDTIEYEILSVTEINNYFKPKSYYDVDLSSKYAIAKKIGDPKILFEKKPNEVTAQASLTKLTTILVAMDHVDDWNALAPIDSASFNFLREQNSAMVGFYPGEKTTFLDLLYGSLLNSGGEAITSLAINAVGSEAEMIRLMNIKAQELHLQNTHYASVVGLDTPNHYSNASDMLRIFEEAYSNPLIKEIMMTQTKTTYTSSHPQGITMISTILPSVINDPNRPYTIKGGKSGTSFAAGLNWITVAEIDGEEYISVIMGAPWNSQLKQIEDTHKVFNLLALNRFR